MKTKKTKGLTLVELIVAMAIFSILAAIAVPSMDAFMRNNRLSSTTNDLATTLNLARSEAVKRGTPIKTCISNAAQDNCDTTTTNWENGWITFIDSDNDNNIDANETVLRLNASPKEGITVRNAQDNNTITFDRDGSASDTGSFVICGDSNNMVGRGINISLSGSISAARDTDDDKISNIYTDDAGNWGNLTCP
ncbi:GspH/FimT family pseudopilin [Thiohalophilus thiocyanatoxydans]|uniref:Type II secretion system protein H n=1 Tax=Thiohalophilus thiocyanatoxydans TaxID=381308 RepID=A0A4R8IEA7_9GAMM|nr:GspH/FimT family pseudopilin [Thiohalophilus thiocyanatoxydans]TDX97919.1 type IV fimbrial biogenesis protein FimT [Thiohalophilus thiocyanatoxydans]